MKGKTDEKMVRFPYRSLLQGTMLVTMDGLWRLLALFSGVKGFFKVSVVFRADFSHKIRKYFPFAHPPTIGDKTTLSNFPTQTLRE